MQQNESALRSFGGPPDQLESLLRQALVEDSQALKRANIASRLLWAGGIGLFFSYIPLGFLVVLVSPLTLLLFPLSLVAMYLLWKFYRANSGRVSDAERFQLAIDYLAAISPDLASDKPMQVELDVRPFLERPVLKRDSTLGPVVQSSFDQLWLRLQATTVAGDRLKIQVTRKGSYKQKFKRRRTKSNLRYSDLIQIAIRPGRGQKYPVSGAPVPLPPKRHGLTPVALVAGADGCIYRCQGPVYSRRVNNGETEGGDRLRLVHLLRISLTAFKALRGSSRASTA